MDMEGQEVCSKVLGDEEINKNNIILLENGITMEVPEKILQVCEAITKLNQTKLLSMTKLKNLMVDEIIKQGCVTTEEFSEMSKPYLLIYVRYVAIGELLSTTDEEDYPELFSHGGNDLYIKYQDMYVEKKGSGQQVVRRNRIKSNEASGNCLGYLYCLVFCLQLIFTLLFDSSVKAIKRKEECILSDVEVTVFI